MFPGVSQHDEPAYNDYKHTGKYNQARKKEVFEIGNVRIPTPRIKWLENIYKQQGEDSRKQYQAGDIAFFVEVCGNL